MKWLYFFITIFFVVSFSSFSGNNPDEKKKESVALLTPISLSNLKIKGYPGEKIDLCISERIKKQDVEHLIEPFRNKTETRLWQSEFWGKWILSAIAAYKYNSDPELLLIIKNAVEDLIETQLPNGYIGNYPPENQLTAWDIGEENTAC